MNNKFAEFSSQVWPDVESGESDTPKKHRRGRRGGRHHRHDTERVITSEHQNYKHEYSADELGTALIWARDPKEAEHALIRSDLSANEETYVADATVDVEETTYALPTKLAELSSGPQKKSVSLDE